MIQSEFVSMAMHCFHKYFSFTFTNRNVVWAFNYSANELTYVLAGFELVYFFEQLESQIY